MIKKIKYFIRILAIKFYDKTEYYVVPKTTTTICSLVLMNGFVVNGESAAASKENFDVEIGKKVAYENAREQIWKLEGYLLKQKLFEGN